MGKEVEEMSATFNYSPTKSKKSMKSGTSSTARVVRDIFGEMPVTLTEEHYASIHALSLGVKDDEFWSELEGILDIHKSIVLDVEY